MVCKPSQGVRSTQLIELALWHIPHRAQYPIDNFNAFIYIEEIFLSLLFCVLVLKMLGEVCMPLNPKHKLF